MTVLIVVVAAAVGAGLVAAGVIWGGGRLVGRLAGTRPPTAAEAERMDVYVEALCLGAGLAAPRIAVIDEQACAALAYGRGPRNATVAVTTGALAEMSSTEVEATLAHLLARVADGTVRRGTLLGAVAALGGPPAGAWVRRRLDGSQVVAADVTAARLTRFPPALAAALERMDRSAGAMRRSPGAIRHLWMHEAPGPGSAGIGIQDRITVLGDL